MGGGTHQSHNNMLPPPNASKSYWRSELHWIDEYRSTEHLPSECDILVIGAGMAGVSTAYHLLDGQWPSGSPSVVILEARQVCSGATGRNGGHVRFGPSKIRGRIEADGYSATATITEFVVKTMHAIKHVIEKEKINAESELHRTFDILLDTNEAKKAKESFRKLLSYKFPHMDEIDFIGEEFVERITSVKGAKAALSAPVLSLWPYKFVTQLLARVLKMGNVNLQTNTPVYTLKANEDESTTVFTPRGSLRAKTVVFATNAYSAGLLPQYRDAIIPIKALATHISIPKGSDSRVPYLSNTYNIGHGSGRDDYVNPRPDGGVVVGGGKWLYVNDRKHWHDTVDDSTLINPTINHYFDWYMQRHFVGWEGSGARVDSIWTGIVTESKDSLPHIGPVPNACNQYLIGGFNGGGMSLIFLSAAGIARMIREGCSFKDTGIPEVFQTTSKRILGAGDGLS